MNKAKTKKAITKRFTLKKSGKMMRRTQTSRHLRANKSRKQIRRFRKPKELSKTFGKKLRKLIIQ